MSTGTVGDGTERIFKCSGGNLNFGCAKHATIECIRSSLILCGNGDGSIAAADSFDCLAAIAVIDNSNCGRIAADIGICYIGRLSSGSNEFNGRKRGRIGISLGHVQSASGDTCPRVGGIIDFDSSCGRGNLLGRFVGKSVGCCAGNAGLRGRFHKLDSCSSLAIERSFAVLPNIGNDRIGNSGGSSRKRSSALVSCNLRRLRSNSNSNRSKRAGNRSYDTASASCTALGRTLGRSDSKLFICRVILRFGDGIARCGNAPRAAAIVIAELISSDRF